MLTNPTTLILPPEKKSSKTLESEKNVFDATLAIIAEFKRSTKIVIFVIYK